MSLLDAAKTRPLFGGPSFSLGHRLFRMTWSITWVVLAAWTPAPLHRWRVFLLRLFGAKIDWTAHIYGTANIWYPPNLTMKARSCLGRMVDCYCMAPIFIGEGAIVSKGTTLCSGTHDIEDPQFQLLVSEINISRNVWIAAECFIGPGVNIGEGAVLGSRTVLFGNADPYGVYMGNPAMLKKNRNLK